jgi:hypothetical protein
MKSANATKINRKSGEAEGPAVSLSGTAKVSRANRLRVSFLHQRKLQVPRLPPDFLSSFVVSINLMRLSLLKAAYVAVG